MIKNFEDYLQLIFLAAQLPSVPRDLIFINLHKGFNQELCQEIRYIRECSKGHQYHLMVGPNPRIHVFRFLRKSPFVEWVKLYNTQRQIFKDWGFSEREAREIAISALDTYPLKNRLNDQLKQCFFYPLSSFKHFAMTSETHNQDITSLITLDYFKFASYMSKCLKIKIYNIYNLEWDGQ